MGLLPQAVTVAVDSRGNANSKQRAQQLGPHALAAAAAMSSLPGSIEGTKARIVGAVVG